MNGEVKVFCCCCFLGGRVRVGGAGGQGRCERRNEVLVEIQKNGGSGLRGRVGMGGGGVGGSG